MFLEHVSQIDELLASGATARLVLHPSNPSVACKVGSVPERSPSLAQDEGLQAGGLLLHLSLAFICL